MSWPERPPGEAELDSVCLHNLLDGDPESVFFKDAEGRYLRLSRAHAYSLGLDDPTAAIGRTAADLLPSAEAGRVEPEAPRHEPGVEAGHGADATDDVDRRSVLFTQLKKIGEVREFLPPEGPELQRAEIEEPR